MIKDQKLCRANVIQLLQELLFIFYDTLLFAVVIILPQADGYCSHFLSIRSIAVLRWQCYCPFTVKEVLIHAGIKIARIKKTLTINSYRSDLNLSSLLTATGFFTLT